MVAVAALAACAPENPPPRSSVAPGKITSTSGPYVSVAVDNHFHDVHPEDEISFDAGRRFVVRNEGRNLHNVTFAELDYSRDLRPGKELQVPPLEPGTYHFICKYHDDIGMSGGFTVSE
ncbi:MAG: cupredoxin domain-containing protein [Actinomycetota bacterium]|nr:cupredoxin domain-containing protein [Actinomycetota bacterium]